jgi:PAB-dependent poly(A)-specific ribonuclease subunit 2
MSGSTFSPNLVAAATNTPEIILLNSMIGGAVRQVSVPSQVTNLQFSHSTLLCASADGCVRAHDPRTGIRRENGDGSVHAHSSGVQDMQATGNFFFTIGWSLRSNLSLFINYSRNNQSTDVDMSFLIPLSKYMTCAT